MRLSRGRADSECAPNVPNQRNLSKVVTFVESSDQVEGGRCSVVGVFDLRPALYLPFLNDVKEVALVPLVENELTSAHVNNLQTIDQFKFGILLKTLEQLNFVQVLQADISSANRVRSDDLLEDVTGEDPGFAVSYGSDRGCTLVIV